MYMFTSFMLISSEPISYVPYPLQIYSLFLHIMLCYGCTPQDIVFDHFGICCLLDRGNMEGRNPHNLGGDTEDGDG
jgi:hypothetical protein